MKGLRDQARDLDIILRVGEGSQERVSNKGEGYERIGFGIEE